jgi:hypothetical protein
MRLPASDVVKRLQALSDAGSVRQVTTIKWLAACPKCGHELEVISSSRDWTTLYCSAGCSPSEVEAALPRPSAAGGGRNLEAVVSGDGPRSSSKPRAEKAKLHRLDITQMLREDPPEVPWVVEGLVARGALTVLNGREGEGKSLLAMVLAVGVATGTDEGGLVCRPGRVSIVDAENGRYEIHRRVKSLGLPAEGVELHEPEGFDLRRDLGELERVLEADRPDLLVLDAYRSLWGGEENDSREVAAVLDPLRNLVRRYDAGALLLHHSGKGNGGGYRGSSAIGASAELGFTLARAPGDPDRARRYIETWKCRPAPEPPKRWLRLSAEMGLVLIDAAEPFAAEEEERTPEAPAQQELAPKLLGALARGPLGLSDLARAVGKNPGNGSVTRTMRALEEQGSVERGEDKLYRLSTFPLSTRPRGSGKVESGKPALQAGLRRVNELAAAGLETEAEALYASLEQGEEAA